jgi:undecaprenyl diphosphate synthase
MKKDSTPEVPDRIPTHIAIIMDGNGRWALSRGLPRLAGHRAGTENLRRVIEACIEFGIDYLTLSWKMLSTVSSRNCTTRASSYAISGG